MSDYKKPRGLNAVSILLYLGAAAAIYWGVQYGPPHYRKWKAKGILGDSTAAYYAQRRMEGAAEGEFLANLRRRTESKFRELGVTDPNLRIQFTKSATHVGASAEYQELVKHPLVNKTSVLLFNPTVSMEITQSPW